MPHPIPSADLPPIDRLRAIMHILRAPGGCPWDAEQTHSTLVKHLVEEAYEVAEAVENGDRDELVDELGDILLQPVFHAEIASETGSFTFDDIAAAICEKLIRRHPHVFGDSVADTPDAVLGQWGKIKAAEKAASNRTVPSGVVPDGVGSETQQGGAQPVYVVEKANEGMPALMAAQKIQKKVAAVGFDWPELAPVLDKVREELGEVVEAMDNVDDEAIAEEIGDLLFSVVNLARKTGHEAELLLDRANRKFVDRFHKVEDALHEKGSDVEAATLEEMDAVWNLVKN